MPTGEGTELQRVTLQLGELSSNNDLSGCLEIIDDYSSTANAVPLPSQGKVSAVPTAAVGSAV